MGNVQDAIIPFLEQPKEFADLFNGFVFDGIQVIQPEKLSPLSESERAVLHTKTGSFETVTRYRDIGRMAAIGTNQVLLVCAVEPQHYLDYSMPQRVMLYEGLDYHGQIETIMRVNKEKNLPRKYYISKVTLEDRLIPVITIVVYSGVDEWEGARSLHDMLNLDGIPEKALPYIGNWPLNLIDLNEPIDASKYHSDLRLLFELAGLKQDEDAMNDYIRNHEEFRNLNKYTSHMLFQYLNVNVKPDDYKNEELGGINMCKAIEDMMETARKKGLEQGRVLGEQDYLMRQVQLKYDKGKNLGQIAAECETTEENILSVMEEMHLIF